MASLKISNLSKYYYDKPVVKDISIDIQEGELIVVVGPSGCGKSTLLRMIAGLEEITSGELYIDQKRVNKVPPKDRNIAMVFQHYALYPHMSVYNNMAYGLRMRSMPKKEIQTKVERVAKILELEPVLYRKPRELSGGQRQRVAMGRAMVREPDVFLFDEPLSNLDTKLRVQMRLEIKKLQCALNTTSIYVTHDQIEAMTLADRMIVMNKGLVEQIGTPLEIYENPKTEFVASFIGSSPMNLLPATVSENGKTIQIQPNINLDLQQKTLPKQQSIKLGFRPEHLNLTTPDKAHFTVQVCLLEKLGSDTLVYSKLPTTNTMITARLPGSHKVKVGDILHLSLKEENLHFF